MRTFEIVCYVVALILFAVAALWPDEPAHNARVRLIGLGLAVAFLVPLVVLIRQ